jgi:hypothetical protein
LSCIFLSSRFPNRRGPTHNAFQPRGEQPPANYEMFTRAHITELGRPKSMPYNVAAADSSRHSFASGKLDFIPYFMIIDDVDREDWSFNRDPEEAADVQSVDVARQGPAASGGERGTRCHALPARGCWSRRIGWSNSRQQPLVGRG